MKNVISEKEQKMKKKGKKRVGIPGLEGGHSCPVPPAGGSITTRGSAAAGGGLTSLLQAASLIPR